MAVKDLTANEFNDAVAVPEKLLVVDFWASWCGPCKMLSPVIDALSEEMTDVTFYKVNVDDERSLASHFGVSSIPTVVMIKDKQIVNQFVGYADKATVRSRIEECK